MDATTKDAVKLVAKELAKGTVIDLTMRVGIVLGVLGAGLVYGTYLERKEKRAKNAQKD